jgi:hypothetical protein
MALIPTPVDANVLPCNSVSPRSVIDTSANRVLQQNSRDQDNFYSFAFNFELTTRQASLFPCNRFSPILTRTIFRKLTGVLVSGVRGALLGISLF